MKGYFAVHRENGNTWLYIRELTAFIMAYTDQNIGPIMVSFNVSKHLPANATPAQIELYVNQEYNISGNAVDVPEYIVACALEKADAIHPTLALRLEMLMNTYRGLN